MRTIIYIAAVCFALTLLISCAGPDYMPVYFPQKEEVAPGPSEKPDADESGPAATGSCTVNLSSTLCVALSTETLKVGTDGAEPLCADIDPIPIEVVGGTNLILRGNTFPDIPFEGHGLPAPITINAKGSKDGADNVGTGTIDEAGNMVIEGFSFFINALGMVGEVPGLTLTTGELEPLEGLETISGEPLAADGHVKLVIGTIVGHLFPAADEKLFGASMQATIEGTITPPLSECKGKGGTSKPQSTFVTKLVLEDNGSQTEALLPGSSRLELGSAFIAEGATDIGPDYESSAKFKIVNATSKAMKVEIPTLLNSFFIESISGGNLKQELQPKTPLIIRITFRPSLENGAEDGDVQKMLTIGSDVYQLSATAVKKKGKISLETQDDKGVVSQTMDTLKVGNVTVSSTVRREFFSCSKQTCDGVEKPTSCLPCVDVLVNVCQLLPVAPNGDPIGVVDASCKELNPAKEGFEINLTGNTISPVQQVVIIKNSGVKDLTIKSLKVEDVQGSRSKQEFRVSGNVSLPVTLKPQDNGGDYISAVVVYEPKDLVGFDGATASVGSPVKDKGILRVIADSGSSSVELSGITIVKEVPALEIFMKSASGTKQQTDNSEFAFRGITMETADLAVPLFIKLSDSATASLKITKITSDSPVFEWLDSKEKIAAKPDGSRCEIPVFDANGGLSSTIKDVNPVSLLPDGFELAPGSYSTDNMPVFGCVNYHPTEKKRQQKGKLTISSIELGRDGKPLRNADGSLKQIDLSVNLLAVINPLKGKIVFRMTQTMAAVMNPQFATISAAASQKEMDWQIEDKIAVEKDRFVMPSAVILDPFDEETLYDEQGNVLSVPGDGVTAVYRKIDTHPVSQVYDDILLPDYTSLIFDAGRPEGERGAFFDYPNVPTETKSGALRIYTASLSWPGPIAAPDERPETLSMCQEVDPCSEEGQRMMGEGPSDKSKLGVCAFFYVSAGAWQSPSFHSSSEMEGGEMKDLCKEVDKPQKLGEIGGHYNLNGNITFSNIGLRLWGPNYFNNPRGPLGVFPPMDAIFDIAFTTEVLQPKLLESGADLIPDKRVNTSKLEHKINLTDTTLETPRLCEASVKNRKIRGEYYSTWKYLAPFLVKDEEGTIPAGCPGDGEGYTGGSAFLRGRPMDHETGITTLVGTAKFASDNDLTFAFKDVMFFIVLNGWLCDPNGTVEELEGERCYDNVFNERDGLSTVSILP